MQAIQLRSWLALVLSFAAAVPIAAQQQSVLPFDACALLAADDAAAVWGTAEELRRLTEVSGAAPERTIPLRRGSDPLPRHACFASNAAPPLLEIGPAAVSAAPFRAGTWLNGGYPDDRDNSFVWAGRGLSLAASGGLVFRAGPVRAAFLPAVAFQQNRDFAIRERIGAGFPEYANPYYAGIDYPQRMGTDSYWQADWAGQSYLRADAWGLGAGISHENFLVGPARRNPILMSATASGFTHLFVGTTRPLDLWLVGLTGQVVVGRLEESDHFDQIPENDHSGLALWTIGLQFRGLDGLELGVARVHMSRREVDERFDFRGLGEVLALGSETNLFGNEMASLFMRWVMPDAGAEVYGEWARDDRYAGIVQDLIPEPDHSQAFTVGLQKLTQVERGVVRVEAEVNHLQEKHEERTRGGIPIYYTHQRVRQGYTHRGQLLGAGIGPGADAQFFGIDWMDGWGYAGMFLERVRRNDGSRAAIDARWTWPYEHDTELTAGLRGLLIRHGLSASATLSYSRRFYRDFLGDHDDSVRLTAELTVWPAVLARRQ